MRDILFRGKTKDGKWVEGDFVRIKDGDIVTPYIYYHGEVIEKTVGQFTGLTDKNGKKIFEGDIVKYDNGLFEVAYYPPHMAYYFHGLHGRGGVNGFTRKSNDIEVIGNIYDNPELLEVE